MKEVKTSARVIITCDDHALMSLSRNSKTIKFLGGAIEKGESAHAAAIREAREEGGIDLSSYPLKELPYQDNPERSSYWFWLNIINFSLEMVTPGDDVSELFLVGLQQVESRLSHKDWRAHWSEELLPSIRAQQ